MNFEIFDESIGIAGYYDIIRNAMFPNSTEFSFDIVSFLIEERFYPKGSFFSRVRSISHEKANEFLAGRININDFYPPRPNSINIPEGRFNRAKNATMYLADHPFVAMKECDIVVGDFFLLSYFSLPKNMYFMLLKDNKDKITSLLYNLLKSKDKRFYPVINLIYSDFLNFDKHDGIAYDSTKVNSDFVDVNGWGPISSVTNIAIQNINIRKFKFEVSWLMYCDKNFKPVQYAIYTPLSDKKTNQISKLNYTRNKNKFIETTNRVNNRLHEDRRRGKLLLDKNSLKMSDETPVKIISKR